MCVTENIRGYSTFSEAETYHTRVGEVIVKTPPFSKVIVRPKETR